MMNFDLTVYFFYYPLHCVRATLQVCVCGSQLNILTGVKWAKDEALNDIQALPLCLFTYDVCILYIQ